MNIVTISLTTGANTFRLKVHVTSSLTTGSRQPRMAAYTSILPTLTLTGSAARWWPRGVRRQVSAKQAPTSRSRDMARWTLEGCGGSRQPARNPSGWPSSHFCHNNRTLESVHICVTTTVPLDSAHICHNNRTSRFSSYLSQQLYL